MMNKRGFIIKMIIIFLVLIIGSVVYFNWDKTDENDSGVIECSSDSDCVPATCCHAASCVSVEEKSNCEGVFCTAVCEPGTLDCGQGSCMCVDGKCRAVFK